MVTTTITAIITIIITTAATISITTIIITTITTATTLATRTITTHRTITTTITAITSIILTTIITAVTIIITVITTISAITTTQTTAAAAAISAAAPTIILETAEMTDEEILRAFNQKREKDIEKRKNDIKKAVIRPSFTLHKELLMLISAIAVMAVCIYFGSALSGIKFTLLLAFLLVLFFISQTKNIMLLLIFLYQKFAPAFIRNACLFTPSCSEYMRISLTKYGVRKGFIKGVKRLRRCQPPNGGIDEP